jgi:hypothetical protein
MFPDHFVSPIDTRICCDETCHTRDDIPNCVVKYGIKTYKSDNQEYTIYDTLFDIIDGDVLKSCMSNIISTGHQFQDQSGKFITGYELINKIHNSSTEKIRRMITSSLVNRKYDHILYNIMDQVGTGQTVNEFISIVLCNLSDMFSLKWIADSYRVRWITSDFKLYSGHERIKRILGEINPDISTFTFECEYCDNYTNFKYAFMSMDLSEEYDAELATEIANNNIEYLLKLAVDHCEDHDNKGYFRGTNIPLDSIKIVNYVLTSDLQFVVTFVPK